MVGTRERSELKGRPYPLAIHWSINIEKVQKKNDGEIYFSTGDRIKYSKSF